MSRSIPIVLSAILIFAGSVGSAKSFEPSSFENVQTFDDLEVTNHFIGAEELDWSEAMPVATTEPSTHLQSFDFTKNLLGFGGIDISAIVRVGKKLWNLFVGGYVDPTFKSASVSVVPDGIENTQVFAKLSNWSRPLAYKYTLKIKQRFGGNGVEFDYKVILSHGGKYNGKGNYLANVRVVPDAHPKIKWAWKFDAQVITQAPINLGSMQNPMAGLELGFQYTAKPKVGKTRTGVKSFFISGDGAIQEM